MDDFDYINKIIKQGDIDLLNEIEFLVDDFPYGKDHFVGRHWIINAIDFGAVKTIKWMLDRKVDLDFVDDEGFTPILAAIEFEGENMFEIIRLLIEYGAPIDKQGINSFTPLHLAARRNDLALCQLLVESGANYDIKTKIDDYATPLEEAKLVLKKGSEVIIYLESISTKR